jgi:hypothetical protein
LLASWIPKIDFGEKIKTRREEGEEAYHRTRRRREGRENRARKEGRKQRWVSWSFLSTTFSLPLWDPCSSESATTKANPLTCKKMIFRVSILLLLLLLLLQLLFCDSVFFFLYWSYSQKFLNFSIYIF